MFAQLYEEFYYWFILEDVFQWENFQKENGKKDITPMKWNALAKFDNHNNLETLESPMTNWSSKMLMVALMLPRKNKSKWIKA